MIIDQINKSIYNTIGRFFFLGGGGGSCVKKQHIGMLLVSDVTNIAQVWVDACELSLIDLFSLLE